MWKSKTGYYRNRHSCFLLRYHFALITKYRHEVIKDGYPTLFGGNPADFEADLLVKIIASSCDTPRLSRMPLKAIWKFHCENIRKTIIPKEDCPY